MQIDLSDFFLILVSHFPHDGDFSFVSGHFGPLSSISCCFPNSPKSAANFSLNPRAASAAPLLVLLQVCLGLTIMRLIPRQSEEISISSKSFQGSGIKKKAYNCPVVTTTKSKYPNSNNTMTP